MILRCINSVSKAAAGRHNCMEEVLISKMASRHKDSTRIQAWPHEASKWPASVSLPCLYRSLYFFVIVEIYYFFFVTQRPFLLILF